jgi:hypothetical protein
MAASSFFETLTAAINDLTQHGFDSVERLDHWTEQLRIAARESLVSEKTMQAILKDGLVAIYKRLVENGAISRYNPGVPRFTIEHIKPALRSELDRRIMASAQLIRLNREQAIEKTLQRFQGWATSIPVGGTKAEDKRETKSEIRKSLAQLPFLERRVLIDQGHRLTANISEVLAMGTNAIAAEWHSQWRQRGYDARKDHKERDLKIYLVRGNWASEKGFVRPSDAGYYDDITHAAEEINCRCYIRWIYNLRSLPESMLTEKGRQDLERVRRQIAAGPLAAPGSFS